MRNVTTHMHAHTNVRFLSNATISSLSCSYPRNNRRYVRHVFANGQYSRLNKVTAAQWEGRRTVNVLVHCEPLERTHYLVHGRFASKRVVDSVGARGAHRCPTKYRLLSIVTRSPGSMSSTPPTPAPENPSIDCQEPSTPARVLCSRSILLSSSPPATSPAAPSPTAVDLASKSCLETAFDNSTWQQARVRSMGVIDPSIFNCSGRSMDDRQWSCLGTECWSGSSFLRSRLNP